MNLLQCGSIKITRICSRAASLFVSVWKPSFVSVISGGRDSGLVITHGIAQHERKPLPGRAANPTLIRPSALKHLNGFGQNQTFRPVRGYYVKAILTLNGGLDAMAGCWTKAERVSQRRLVHFTRAQTGWTIYGFKPITSRDRTPHSICIRCTS